MESSSYKVVLNSSDIRDATEHIQHYGVRGMKWGVIRDDDEKRRSEYNTEAAYNSQKNRFSNFVPAQRPSQTRTPTYASSEYQSELAYNSMKNIRGLIDQLPAESKRQLMTSAQDFLKSKDGQKIQEKINDIVSKSPNMTTEEAIKSVMGVASEIIESEELIDQATELIDDVKDVALDELEKENPMVGKTLKTVDTFFENVGNFVTDFTKGVQNIVSGISSWFGNLFSKDAPSASKKNTYAGTTKTASDAYNHPQSNKNLRWQLRKTRLPESTQSLLNGGWISRTDVGPTKTQIEYSKDFERKTDERMAQQKQWSKIRRHKLGRT